jgi:hypothetical protein
MPVASIFEGIEFSAAALMSRAVLASTSPEGDIPFFR